MTTGTARSPSMRNSRRRASLSVVPTSAALDRLQDKARLAALLEELRVPMPLTRRISQ